MAEKEFDDNIQHGIDDDPNNDPEKARNIGGIAGAVTGLAAGAVAGPLGAIGGAIVGGVAGALGSQAAVAAVDKHDNDNNVTGLGDKVQYKDGDMTERAYADNPTGAGIGNGVPGIQTGGHDYDGSPDTRGITEKVADTVTGDNIDDKTGKPVNNSGYASGYSSPTGVPNGVPGIQTGGHDYDGSPDTRGITEKVADTVTGDNIDDKTGKPVNNSGYNSGYSTPTGVPNGVPGIQTGGHDADGSPDTRGITEKVADTLTGDNVDDKTGKRVD